MDLGLKAGMRSSPAAVGASAKPLRGELQLGGLHILVNSGSAPGGSTTATGPIETVVDEDLLQDFNVKYVGALRCSRAVIPFMKREGWGRIINISGGNARNAGLVHMTKTLAVQLDELRRASRYPKFRDVLQPHRVGRLLNNLQGATIVDRLPSGYEAADPHDAWLLALSDTAHADYLVTGDKRSGLLAKRRIGSTRTLTAAAFCEVIG
ncbi:MAG TPA: SDR family NAD(P)-dependent oxidoreductase [Stellaceae bacterium]|nr:SDR family NAD(P)-dependent oxidoreductase [Stellaceae bacterium]